MNDLRQRFQARFVATANDRLKRALAALHADPVAVYNELHGLAGEAGIIGFTEISAAASAGQQIARAWRTAKPTADQQLQCARVLRSLLGLVNDLERSDLSSSKPASAPATRCALVIDDSELIAEELADVLRDAGFQASTASTIDEAVASVLAAPPDVVLVDAHLPGVDLHVLCARLREHAKTARLMIVSASTEDELRRFAQEVGADGYVGKLQGTASIVERVQALLAGGP
jgi:CheY-like chemotaxis protein